MPRWFRTFQLALIPVFLIGLTLWLSPTPQKLIQNTPIQQILQSGQVPSTERTTAESPLLLPSKTTLDLETGEIANPPNALTKSNPSFHLLITGSSKGPGLCRTIVSAAVLNYPPPTLIGYDATDPASRNTIRSVREYLQQPQSGLEDRDLVLIVDSGSTFFQLPSNVFIHRHEAELVSANAWSKEEYGQNEDDAEEPRFSQAVFSGAAKMCVLPNQDVACKSVPVSPVRASSGRQLTARYLDSGTILGLVPAISKLLDATADKMEKLSRGGGPGGHLGIISKVFGDQEIFRRARTPQRSGFRTGWKSFVSGKKLEKLRPASEGGEDDTANTHKSREYGLGLDYQSSLFQSGADSDEEIAIISFDNSSLLNALKQAGRPVKLAKDLATSGPPFHPSLTGSAPESVSSQSAMPYNSTLDDLPIGLTWNNIPLAVNVEAASIPAVLHLSSTSSSTNNLISAAQSLAAAARWKQLWFQPYARAMMRHHIRSSEGEEARLAAVTGGDQEWGVRGGKGGAWTVDGNWLDFAEICRGFEEEIFGDSKGEWGLEGGGHPRCSKNGDLISGEGECEKPEEHAEGADGGGAAPVDERKDERRV